MIFDGRFVISNENIDFEELAHPGSVVVFTFIKGFFFYEIVQPRSVDSKFHRFLPLGEFDLGLWYFCLEGCVDVCLD